MKTLTISKEINYFVVDDITVPGSPPVGRGRTIKEAIGDYFWNNQTRFNFKFDVHASASISLKRNRLRDLKAR